MTETYSYITNNWLFCVRYFRGIWYHDVAICCQPCDLCL